MLDETGLRITPLKADTPPEVLRAAQHAYGMMPRPRITDLLLEVDSWTRFRFTPRLRDLKDRKLYVFRGQAVPDVLAGMIGGTVDADHVRAHWNEALRLAVLVGSGHASASGMLRRLAAYPRQNGLAVSLREIGRVERSLFTLD